MNKLFIKFLPGGFSSQITLGGSGSRIPPLPAPISLRVGPVPDYRGVRIWAASEYSEVREGAQ